MTTNELASAYENAGQAGGWYPQIIRVVDSRTYDATPHARRTDAPLFQSRADAVLAADLWLLDARHGAFVQRRLDGFDAGVLV